MAAALAAAAVRAAAAVMAVASATMEHGAPSSTLGRARQWSVRRRCATHTTGAQTPLHAPSLLTLTTCRRSSRATSSSSAAPTRRATSGCTRAARGGLRRARATGPSARRCAASPRPRPPPARASADRPEWTGGRCLAAAWRGRPLSRHGPLLLPPSSRRAPQVAFQGASEDERSAGLLRSLAEYLESCGGTRDMVDGWHTKTEIRREGNTAGTRRAFNHPPHLFS